MQVEKRKRKREKAKGEKVIDEEPQENIKDNIL